jgi:LPS sulfotransferase NodH
MIDMSGGDEGTQSHLYCSPAMSYVIAATPRTGSYLLCEGLQETGIAGFPTETFAFAFEAEWLRRWDLQSDSPFLDYFQHAIHEGTTSNGVYGLKIHWMHIAPLAARLSLNESRVLEDLFPNARFVNIVRRDRRAQAISYYRALISNEWWRMSGVNNWQANTARAVFDRAAILHHQSKLEYQQACWERYFEERQITALTIEYESLVDDYQGQIARVLRFLQLDDKNAHELPAPKLLPQRDQTSAQWHLLLSD